MDAKAVAEEVIKAERGRVAMIHCICNGDFPEIEAKAVAEGWDRNKVNEAVLAAFREKQPMATPAVVVKKGPEMNAKHLEAALSLRAGISGDVLAKEMGEETVCAAEKDMDMPLRAVLGECMRLEGMSVPHTFDNAAIKAAFSTVSLPGILSNVANKKLLQSYMAQPIIATKLCTTGDLTDFKENQRIRLTDIGDLKPVGAENAPEKTRSVFVGNPRAKPEPEGRASGCASRCSRPEIGAAPCGHFAAARLVRSTASGLRGYPPKRRGIPRRFYGAFPQGQAHADRGTKCAGENAPRFRRVGRP